jgi:plasmid stability protein
MSILAVRLSDQDKDALAGYARFHGKSISAMAREILIEKLADEYDMKVARKYESEQEHVTHSWESVKRELGL